MGDVQRHPVDYDALEKGSVIPSKRIEEITNTKRGTADYQFAMMILVDRVQRELRDRGKDWTVRSLKGDIKVLTDAEASTYNHRLQQQARRSMLRRFHLNSAVDVNALNPEQRQAHDRVMEIDSKYIQALATARQQLRVEAHKRNVPKLGSG